MFRKIGLILEITGDFAWWNWLIALIIGIAFFFFGLYFFDEAQRFDAVALHAYGRIVDAEFTYTSDRSEGDSNHKCVTRVTFVTRAGSNTTFTSNSDRMLVWSTRSGRNRCEGKVGKVVDVAYDPQNAGDATVGWNKFSAYVMIVPIIMGGGLAAIGAIALIWVAIAKTFRIKPSSN